MPANEALRQRLQSAVHVVNSHRLLFYGLASVTAVAAVVVNALKNHSNFYSVAIYLSKSSRSVLALANFCFLIALLCGHIVQRIFFGPLRANEIERLYDRLWFFITESLLAFTIFRDEFDTSFAFMFGFLLFVKSFHWLASDRIEWMDQRPYPGPPLLFHFRMATLFMVLWATDLIMFVYTIEHTLTVGVGGMVLFASEYGILIASILNTVAKYLLSAYEFRRAGQRGGDNAPPWENKSMWTFYIELATDFAKLTVYLAFFSIIITFYGLPLNILRDVYMTARSFITRLRALHNYRTATKNMDQRYPNATEEELTAMSDRTCIICREEMVFQEHQTQQPENQGPNMTPKKLPCGHIFHFYCLRSWLERQQSCPTCRRTVFDDNQAAQQTPPAGNPPPLAPGAVPQAGGPPAAAPNANRQAGNNPLGNPLGLMNRILGPPPQANNNAQFQQNQPQGAGNNANNAARDTTYTPPTGTSVLIHYEVQYQGRRPQPGQLQPAEGLTPVPQVPGYHGSAISSLATQGGQPSPAVGTSNSVQPTGTSNLTTSPPEMSRRSTAAQGETLAESDSESSSEDEGGSTKETLSPRDAARQAALRRFGGDLLVPQSNSSGAAAPPLLKATPTTPMPEKPSLTPLPTSPAVSYAPASSTAPVAPDLIPLHDLLFSSDPNNIPSMIRVPDAPVVPESRSLGNIPSHVSDDQLDRLDRLTREAIDERLLVLEGVSNTVYRCIDDLMRMRSTLPSAQPSNWENGQMSLRREEKQPERK
ncbi:synoviolin 1 isoform b [Coprinopsis sp. MPI-PUGE-AT-0042]|nr:synoviolin 1 isoform b [Coprinopsis sp. MPI-PUGE-AT-0042]